MRETTRIRIRHRQSTNHALCKTCKTAIVVLMIFFMNVNIYKTFIIINHHISLYFRRETNVNYASCSSRVRCDCMCVISVKGAPFTFTSLKIIDFRYMPWVCVLNLQETLKLFFFSINPTMHLMIFFAKYKGMKN